MSKSHKTNFDYIENAWALIKQYALSQYVNQSNWLIDEGEGF